ncbi:type I polyketide synthase [uncultured Shewanella sp.]|uniref:type I polyketide synthase n=1 Tax=uncultured Shewanella sp. TaxID=173975 RepID=UPI00262EE6B3|nr:type I polyketide synthase [uncultured Shewanella sp.]
MKSNNEIKQSVNQDDPRLNKRLKDSPIAIVGMANLFPHARYLEQFWDLISDKVNAITDVPDTHWNVDDYFDTNQKRPDKSYCKRGGFLPEVDFNPMEFGLPPNILELTDTSQLLSLLVAKELLADAQVHDEDSREHIGIALGVGGGQKIVHSLTARLQYPLLRKVFKHSGISDDDSEMLIKKFQDQYIHWEENSFPGSLGNVIAGRIANRFNLGGMNCVVDAACAGSLAAMRMAISELVDGRSEMMITGGVCTDNSPSMYMSFSKTPAFTTQEVIQPFDIESKGMMIGEGIGMVALKRLEDAQRDDNRIYAVIKGIGSSSDGKFKSIYAPRSEGQAMALKRAYDDAGILPHSVGLVEAHGTGTAAGDVAEFEGLKRVFEEYSDGLQHIALGSVKSQIGHTKATAGTAGLMKAALALHHKVLPATINVSQPNPKLNIFASPFYLNTETRPWFRKDETTPRRAGISSFGFGGTNFHFVLEEYCAEHQRQQSHTQYRCRQVAATFLFSQATKEKLIQLLNETQQTCQENRQTFDDIAATHGLRELNYSEPRLGFVARNNAELDAAITQALTMFKNNDADNWQGMGGMQYRSQALVNSSNNSKKVAALFAGQGSQYLNMGRELACHFPEIRTHFSYADRVFHQHGKSLLSEQVYPKPVFELSEVKQQEKCLTNTLNAQSAIGALSLGQYELMQAAGFEADMFAGHSFGELTALCAAGVIEQTDYYQLAYARGEAMASKACDTEDKGVMSAVVIKSGLSIAQLESCLADFNDVSIANYNSPTQVVIAGSSDGVDKASQALKALGFSIIGLPVSAAFHTQLVSHAQKPFGRAIDKAVFSSPEKTIYSNVSGEQYVNEGEQIKNSFKMHMLQSVHFSQQILNMYEAGARIFVEFGPKNILQKLVKETLADKAEDVCLISMNGEAKGNSDTQLRSAAVNMAVAGLPIIELDPYQRPKRKPEKLTPMHVKLTAANYISQATQEKMMQSLQSGKVSFSVVPSEIKEPSDIKEGVADIESKPRLDDEKVLVESALSTVNSHNNQATKETELKSQETPNTEALLLSQERMLAIHKAFMAIPKQYNETVTQLMAEQNALTEKGGQISPELQKTLDSYHQEHANTLKQHEQYLALQEQAYRQLRQPHQPRQLRQSSMLVQEGVSPTVTEKIESNKGDSKSDNQMISANNIEPLQEQADNVNMSNELEVLMLQVVAEKTGYPTEMLALDMDMEADLGIDSIKRVEILGTVQTQAQSLPELNPEEMAECRTLGDIVSYLNAQLSEQGIEQVLEQDSEQLPSTQDDGDTVPDNVSTSLDDNVSMESVVEAIYDANQSTFKDELVATNTAAPTAETDKAGKSVIAEQDLQALMLQVVAEKTGYPTEMLDLDMDLEADLGIDSIKRVEILGTVQTQATSLPELNPEEMAECRTLGDIVIYLNAQLSEQGIEPVLEQDSEQLPSTQDELVAANTATSQTVKAGKAEIAEQDLQALMLQVVAEKTGYPAEMLALDMDMEADLGIDSIKRVEILGTVQTQAQSLPELNPEEMAECRTLGDIVSYLNAQLSEQGIEQVLEQDSEQLPSTQDDGDTVPDNVSTSLDDNVSMESVVEAIYDANQSTFKDELVATNTAAPTAETDKAGKSVIAEQDLQALMLQVVAEKTGYPTEMLALDMDLEADLGIDSIKRVEILGTVQTQATSLPELNPEEMAECRTLGDIVIYLNAQLSEQGIEPVLEQDCDQLPSTQDDGDTVPNNVSTSLDDNVSMESVVEAIYDANQSTAKDEPVAANTAAPQTDKAVKGEIAEQDLQALMLQVVAEKTGYPAEMLALDMDMEADLGIDSIKRVEILGTVQTQATSLPELNPEEMAECRTLGEIVTYLTEQLSSLSVKVDQPKCGQKHNTEPNMLSANTANISSEDAQTLTLPKHSDVALTALPALACKNLGAYPQNACIIIVDDGYNAGELAAVLRAQQLQVAVIRLLKGEQQSLLSAEVESFQPQGDDEAAFKDTLDQIYHTFPHIAGFIYLQPNSSVAQQTEQMITTLNTKSLAYVKQAFLWAKLLQPRLTQVKAQARHCFITVSRLDGGFGFVDRDEFKTAELNQSGLTGLTKTLAHEWPSVFCKALDITPKINGHEFAQAILLELCEQDQIHVDIGITPSARTTLTLASGVQPTASSTNVSYKPAVALTCDDVFLVTGGAKGVTKCCALRLAEKTKAHFILAGRSEFLKSEDRPQWALNKALDELQSAAITYVKAQGIPMTPMEVEKLIAPVKNSLLIDEALMAFHAVGASAEYMTMNVIDADSVKQALTLWSEKQRSAKQSLKGGKSTQYRHGISGVIHGAGVIADNYIQNKSLDEFECVYQTKIIGFEHIMNTLDMSRLKVIALFSSSSAFYGNEAQSDYSASNEILNKLALQLSINHPELKIMSFGWGPWDGGMVTDAIKALFLGRGVDIIPLNTGAELFTRQLLSSNAVQLIIGSDIHYTEKTSAQIKGTSLIPNESNTTFVQNIATVTKDVILTRRLNLQTLPVLHDHCIGGNPVLPAVFGIQWMREAAMSTCGLAFNDDSKVQVKVEEYQLLKGVIFDFFEDQVLRLVLKPEERIVDQCQVFFARLYCNDKPQSTARLTVFVNDKSQVMGLPSLADKAGLELGNKIDDALTDNYLYNRGVLFHGPRLQGITAIEQITDTSLQALCQLPNVALQDCGYFKPCDQWGGCQPYAEDLLLQAMLIWARYQYDAASLPTSIEELMVYKPLRLGEKGILQLEVSEHEPHRLKANVFLYHQSGELSVSMKGAVVTISDSLNEAFLFNRIKEHYACPDLLVSGGVSIVGGERS